MRELLRSTDGEITAGEFRKGAWFLLMMTFAAGLLLAGIRALSMSMEWMTVAIAPFFGLIVLFSVCSLIYFWYCVFIKRLRATGHGFVLLHAWLIVMFLASAARLVDFQNKTLDLTQSGPMVYAGFAAIVFSFLAVILFFILIARGWRG